VKDAVANVLKGAEAEGPPLDQLDLVVRAFDEPVGDPFVEDCTYFGTPSRGLSPRSPWFRTSMTGWTCRVRY
jgi:hypothetical protein